MGEIQKIGVEEKREAIVNDLRTEIINDRIRNRPKSVKRSPLR
ncbi:hypothetical protein BN982_02501 [Halobacillus karajensis]|uniref:Uncharacterized protein n=1 Tax=Halobacillus karajensis TaxID=195088 RepID=A0A024P8U6_9BACI|nr:hypothetical protein BN982_02501 [Halobacillus karajensis]CDQ25156.1 hypothetical protein BN983_03466 [Halobacillus karajensis]CDQ28483.1 hypothetical protein BN981_02786 [Halobacillus karajensis]